MDSTSVITLMSPSDGASFIDGDIVFQWRMKADSVSMFESDQFEIAFWSEISGFTKTLTVPTLVSNENYLYRLVEIRRIFRRHGIYRWRVTAMDHEIRGAISEPGEFSISVPMSHEEFVPWSYPYAIQLQVVNRYRNPEYQSFLNSLYSSTPLEDFGSLGLIFRQSRFQIKTLELEERFILLSQVGLGAGLATRARLWQNLYFSLYPKIDLEYHWFSTGLKNYTSTLYSIRLGGEWVLMPKGFVTLQSYWIPAYRIRYAEEEGALRTYQGKGWEAGVRVVIPSHVVSTFNIFGLEIDLRRFPMEFTYSRIHDTYSGTDMEMGQFTVRYLLW